MIGRISLWSSALGLLVLTFTSNPSLPTAVTDQVKKAQRIILDGLVINKDPHIVLHREDILNDYENRISDEFAVPPTLRDRVGFWFDIYTRYDSNHRVIHHSRYPWIIFKVVDVTPIINSDTPKVRWLRNVKADEFVTSELKNVREALKALTTAGAVDAQNEYQVKVAQALEPLAGDLKEKAHFALKNLRIQTGQKNFFAEGLEVSPLYLQGMEEIFRNHKLPVELTRIPFVESSFNRHAVSKVGASGIWQFMDYTGKSFLTVNEHIDERNSPFKATEAAARLLKENHMIMHRSWPLAITAWNHGPTGLRKAIRATESKDLAEIIDSYQTRHFDFASSNFYCEFLAALYAQMYHEEIFKDLQYEKSLELHAVTLAKSVSAKELLRRSGLAKADFILFNPDLKKALERDASIPSGFSIIVDSPARLVLKSLLTKESRAGKDTKISQSDISYNNESSLLKN